MSGGTPPGPSFWDIFVLLLWPFPGRGITPDEADDLAIRECVRLSILPDDQALVGGARA